jgi:hypothetical protein
MPTCADGSSVQERLADNRPTQTAEPDAMPI